MIPAWLSTKLLQLEHVEACGQWVEQSLDVDRLSGILTGNGSLGAGMIYYQLARTLKPEHVLVIGSLRGFAPICFARGLKENGRGKLTFIDAGLIDDFWHDPDRVNQHFQDFGVGEQIEHCRATIEALEKFPTAALQETIGTTLVNLVLIDGHHSYASAERDFNFARHLNNDSPDCLYLFHDSRRNDVSEMYEGFPYLVNVEGFLNHLRNGSQYDVCDLITDLPGLTAVRKRKEL